MDSFLAEMLSLDSKGEWPTDRCAECDTEIGEYQCLECFGRQMLCKGCMVKRHMTLYLHRIQVGLMLNT